MSNDGDIQSGVRDPKLGVITTVRITGASGFTYIALLAIITIIGISLGATGKYWQNVMLRDREQELLFRGDQYRIAIEHYYYAIPGKNQYPQSIEDLLTDSRSPSGKHHLRRKYKDPMTNEDFVEIRDPLTKRIVGVHSASDTTPLKHAEFDAPYEEFAGKDRYSDWQFLSTIKIAPGGVGGFGTMPNPKVPIIIPMVTR